MFRSVRRSVKWLSVGSVTLVASSMVANSYLTANTPFEERMKLTFPDYSDSNKTVKVVSKT